jgi:hypothetical protein
MVGSGENFIVDKDNMQELKERLQRAIKKVPNFDKMKNHIDMTITNEGLRIELTESEKGTFFDSGSAKISGDGAELLKTLAEKLGKLPNTLAMEGHTDSKPYAAGSNYGNWELSSDRECGAPPDAAGRHPRRPGYSGTRICPPAPAKKRGSARCSEPQNFFDRAVFKQAR